MVLVTVNNNTRNAISEVLDGTNLLCIPGKQQLKSTKSTVNIFSNDKISKHDTNRYQMENCSSVLPCFLTSLCWRWSPSVSQSCSWWAAPRPAPGASIASSESETDLSTEACMKSHTRGSCWAHTTSAHIRQQWECKNRQQGKRCPLN